MPLNQIITNLFDGVEHSPTEVVAYDPRWLFAQRCEVWMEATPEEVASILLVYRSVLIEDTDEIYLPIKDLLVEQDIMDVLSHGVRDDDEMMFNKAEYLIVRLRSSETNIDNAPSVEDIRTVLAEALGTLEAQPANG